MTLPPEINSFLMFSGAGSGPLLEAAAAWDGLASELSSAASSFGSVTSGLTAQAWQGPAAAAMASRTAGQARAVVSDFEAAQAATVQPLLVSLNRNSLVQMVMSNWFGLNAPAIAEIEADYEAMWARDVSAMSGYYSGASAAAAGLTPLQGLQSALQGLPGGVASQLGNAAAAAGINLGVGNQGSSNVGNGNNGNSGSYDTGNGNAGIADTGAWNSGSANTGNGNSGNTNTGLWNSGNVNTGVGFITNTAATNSGFGNTGAGDSGFFNTGSTMSGLYKGPPAAQATWGSRVSSTRQPAVRTLTVPCPACSMWGSPGPSLATPAAMSAASSRERSTSAPE